MLVLREIPAPTDQEVTMNANTAAVEAEALCRQFAQAWPTPNVLRGVALCEAGTLAWVDVAAVFARSFGTAKLEG